MNARAKAVSAELVRFATEAAGLGKTWESHLRLIQQHEQVLGDRLANRLLPSKTFYTVWNHWMAPSSPLLR